MSIFNRLIGRRTEQGYSNENENLETSEETLDLKSFSESRMGEEHKANEDSVDIQENLLTVCDGVSGTSNDLEKYKDNINDEEAKQLIEQGISTSSALASFFAAKKINELLSQIPENADMEKEMKYVFEHVDEMLKEKAEKWGVESAQTVATAVKIIEKDGKKKAVVGIVGDVPLYIYQNGKLRSVGYLDNKTTELCQEIIREKKQKGEEISKEEQIDFIQKFQDRIDNIKDKKDLKRKNHDGLDGKVMSKLLEVAWNERNLISNSLGDKDFSGANVFVEDLQENDEIFVMSDGVSDNLTRKEMEEIIEKNCDKNGVLNKQKAIAGLLNKSEEVAKQGKDKNIRSKKDDKTIGILKGEFIKKQTTENVAENKDQETKDNALETETETEQTEETEDDLKKKLEEAFNSDAQAKNRQTNQTLVNIIEKAKQPKQTGEEPQETPQETESNEIEPDKWDLMTADMGSLIKSEKRQAKEKEKKDTTQIETTKESKEPKETTITNETDGNKGELIRDLEAKGVVLTGQEKLDSTLAKQALEDFTGKVKAKKEKPLETKEQVSEKEKSKKARNITNYVEKAAFLVDKLGIGVIKGVLSSFGVRFFVDGFQRIEEEVALKGVLPKNFEKIFKKIEKKTALLKELPGYQEGKTGNYEGEEKDKGKSLSKSTKDLLKQFQDIQFKVETYAASGSQKGSTERKKMARILSEARRLARSEEKTSQEKEQEFLLEVADLTKNYLTAKTSNAQIAKEGLNTALVAAGSGLGPVGVAGAFLARPVLYLMADATEKGLALGKKLEVEARGLTDEASFIQNRIERKLKSVEEQLKSKGQEEVKRDDALLIAKQEPEFVKLVQKFEDLEKQQEEAQEKSKKFNKWNPIAGFKELGKQFYNNLLSRDAKGEKLKGMKALLARGQAASTVWRWANVAMGTGSFHANMGLALGNMQDTFTQGNPLENMRFNFTENAARVIGRYEAAFKAPMNLFEHHETPGQSQKTSSNLVEEITQPTEIAKEHSKPISYLMTERPTKSGDVNETDIVESQNLKPGHSKPISYLMTEKPEKPSVEQGLLDKEAVSVNVEPLSDSQTAEKLADIKMKGGFDPEKFDKIFPGNEIQISKGDKVIDTIVIKEGDTWWDIAKNNPDKFKDFDAINIKQGQAAFELSDLQSTSHTEAPELPSQVSGAKETLYVESSQDNKYEIGLLNDKGGYSTQKIELPQGYKLEEASNSVQNDSISIIDSAGKTHEARLFTNEKGETMVYQPNGKAIPLETHLIGLYKEQLINKDSALSDLVKTTTALNSQAQKGESTEKLTDNLLGVQKTIQGISENKWPGRFNIETFFRVNFLNQQKDLAEWLNQFFVSQKVDKIDDKTLLTVLFEQYKKSIDALTHLTENK